MERAETRSRMLSAAVLLPALLALQGCYEDGEAVNIATGETTARSSDATETLWLEPGSPVAPAAFLSRLSGEEEAALAGLLSRAGGQWREEPRMIANRFAGLWRDNGATLPLSGLITDFLALPRRSGNTLSAEIQSYRVLRDQGEDHRGALARLAQVRHD